MVHMDQTASRGARDRDRDRDRAHNRLYLNGGCI